MGTGQDISRVIVGPERLCIEEILAVASGARIEINRDPAYREALSRSVQALARRLKEGSPVYGVNTGFGDSCEVRVGMEHIGDLPANLVRFHGCGTGQILSEREAAAVMAVRLASLSRGFSAVRVQVLERMCELLNRRILPRIPAEGSVGASGDLTPLSYVAALLMGEREATCDGRIVAASEALAAAKLKPLTLMPKESLSLMNGTSVMTALGCLAWEQARRLARWAAALTAMCSDLLQGNREHFDARIFAAKPHPGQAACARWIRDDIEYHPAEATAPGRLQDRYSVRCAPHVIGVLVDALPWFRQVLEIELNSANDNPIIDPESGDVLHGGNFYGGHVCFVMDALKAVVANLADLMDRQLALLCNPATNEGLPANLVACEGEEKVAHHGFKAMQISASALTAEALKLTMPASVFSRSTECHNQDKVSMGTIAARDCLRVLELTETVAAILQLAACQAVDIRREQGCHKRSRLLHEAVRADVPVNLADRRQDLDIQRVLEMHRSGRLPAGDTDL